MRTDLLDFAIEQMANGQHQIATVRGTLTKLAQGAEALGLEPLKVMLVAARLQLDDASGAYSAAAGVVTRLIEQSPIEETSNG